MVQADMIDTWLLCALVAGILALCAALRAIPAKSPDDRLVAGTVALILLSVAAIALSIAWGMPVILDGMILVALAGLFLMIRSARQPGGDDA
jgi:peptidoglycan/LPS O-acetylase OafA/YrhL